MNLPVLRRLGSSLGAVTEPWARKSLLALIRRFGTRAGAVQFAHAARQSAAAQRLWEAVLYGEGAVAADPTYAPGYAILGRACQESGDLARARETFRRGAWVSGNDPLLLAELADLDAQDGRLAEAEAGYRQVLAVDPNHIGSRVKLAYLLRQQSRLDEAESVLLQSQEPGPLDPFILREYAELRMERGDYRRAVELLRAMVDREPSDAFARESLAYALLATGDVRAAQTELRAAIELAAEATRFRRLERQLSQAIDLLDREYALGVDEARTPEGGLRLRLTPPANQDGDSPAE